ncbi:MAG TPA: hypothetical protein VE863_23120, partial [Pyrinomonadaceae bacterium]|nr:hypothetical protein [Pyrinomonadaceae bacterium]
MRRVRKPSESRAISWVLTCGQVYTQTDRRIATIEFLTLSIVATRRDRFDASFRGLKPTAKFIASLHDVIVDRLLDRFLMTGRA